MENPMYKWMILGYHYFWKHPYFTNLHLPEIRAPISLPYSYLLGGQIGPVRSLFQNHTTLRILGMSWGVKTTCFEAPGVSLGGSGVSIGGVKIVRAGNITKAFVGRSNITLVPRLDKIQGSNCWTSVEKKPWAGQKTFKKTGNILRVTALVFGKSYM